MFYFEAPEFDKKHLKKSEGRNSRNVLNITIRMKTIVRQQKIKQKIKQKYLSFKETTYVNLTHILKNFVIT